MHAEPFDYVRTDTVDETIELLDRTDDARLLAGGQALIPLLKKRKAAPGTLVDISGLDGLRGIERTNAGVRIGALTTHRTVADSALLEESAPVLPAVVSKITGGIQVHNVATVGGNVARAHPTYDYGGALFATEARVDVAGPDGERTVPAEEFYRGACSTCLEGAELITGIEIDSEPGQRYGSYAKKKQPASGGAVVGVASDVVFEGSEITTARIGVNGLQSHAVRLRSAEDVLEGRALSAEAVETAADAAGEAIDDGAILDNKKASAKYRRRLLGPYVRKSLSKIKGEDP